VAVATSSLPLKVHGNVLIGIGMFLGYELGRYVGPDADIMGTTASEGWMVNELPIVGHFLFGILSTYGSIFRRHHRSFWTHFPFVSTLGRYLLIFWWIWWQLYIATQDWAWLIFIFIGAYIGTSLSDGIHWALDKWYNPTGV
jgi:hypothetical protein